MKVKAKEKFNTYRNVTLKLPKKDFRSLQAGKIVDIPKNKIDEYPHLYEVVEKQSEVKRNGDK